VVEEIQIFIEGGGENENTQSILRKGFSQFFSEITKIAKDKNMRVKFILCGGRDLAYRRFKKSLETNPDSFNILLVDAEAPVKQAPWIHLKSRDNWEKPNGADDEICHLMIQTMEAWFMADKQAIASYYGKDFQESALPSNPMIEEIPKSDLEPKLKKAASKTKKGEYQKIDHGSELLSRISAQKVRDASPACERLFQTLAGQMGETI
jgi:Domain of unknown function (DUF4276)